MGGERGIKEKEALQPVYRQVKQVYNETGKRKREMKKEKRGCKDACTGKEADS